MLKYGIVCSGGLAKGAYQLGFLESLHDYLSKEEIKAFAGSSIGIFNAYFYLADKMDLGRELWLNFDAKGYFKLYREIVLKGFINKSIEKIIKEEDVLPCPLYVSASSILPWPGHRYYKISGQNKPIWKKLMRTAIGVPFVTGLPKIFDKKIYVDGSLFDNVPILPLLEEEVDVIIVLHFDSRYKLEKRWLESDKVILELDLSVSNNFLKKAFNFSKDNLNQMYESGKMYGHDIFTRLFKNGKTLEQIRLQADKIMKEELIVRKTYKNIDRWITLLNRLTKKLRKNPKKRIIEL